MSVRLKSQQAGRQAGRQGLAAATLATLLLLLLLLLAFQRPHRPGRRLRSSRLPMTISVTLASLTAHLTRANIRLFHQKVARILARVQALGRGES